jgi:hypothetical protein
MSQPCSQEAAPLSQQAVQHGTTCDAASELHGEQFECPIHGQFRLNPVCSAVVHTPQFQRLGQLKQLGLAYHAFPSAGTHTACDICMEILPSMHACM